MPWPLPLFVSLWGGKTVRSPASVLCEHMSSISWIAASRVSNDVAHAEFVA
jgi:hypothetical protein